MSNDLRYGKDWIQNKLSRVGASKKSTLLGRKIILGSNICTGHKLPGVKTFQRVGQKNSMGQTFLGIKKMGVNKFWVKKLGENF